MPETSHASVTTDHEQLGIRLNMLRLAVDGGIVRSAARIVEIYGDKISLVAESQDLKTYASLLSSLVKLQRIELMNGAGSAMDLDNTLVQKVLSERLSRDPHTAEVEISNARRYSSKQAPALAT